MQENGWQQRTEILMGKEGVNALSEAKVAVIGLGGVGAYAAEMLCRAGVGSLILLDSDVVSLTNKNRQLLASDSTIGRSKCEVMSSRLKDINGAVMLTEINEYLEPDNVEQLIGKLQIDFLIDAIDTLSPKIALIKYCREKGIPLVSSMGAGAKYDATAVRLADISRSYNCPLAYILRKKLRKEGISKGFDVVFSEELPQKDAIIPVEERNKKSMTGTVSYLPAVFGCVCAQAAIEYLIKKR
ncbi:MAG: tRNA threonylcarbamoyladenosine dehydratase [Bacteroidetes bacterium]|uniref:tRNA threonylcarbamoyladenosine dehydratase n=1 Tax=Candidatus Egerieousia excrementavium TaxID=2840778 RepID=A0A9D9DJK2_9BACT|nr:tRNA threonylcarbamoyladenosine dehydratase [Candidatus Egerieousia excrementavium]